jgi:periplasmic nitrate reductase NapD
MNISSAIIHTRSSGMEAVRGLLEGIAGVEVHAAAEGRFVISIESGSDRETADVFEAIQRLEGVLSASLVYSHFESDPDGELSVG